MNKFAAVSILLVGLAAGLAVAAPSANVGGLNMEEAAEFQEISEAISPPSDESEAAFLQGSDKVFTGYCKDSREIVYEYLSSKNREAISALFATFFGSIAEVTEAIAATANKQGEQAADTIKEGDQSTQNEDERVGLIGTVKGAVTNYSKAVLEAGAKEIAARIAVLQKVFTTENFKELANDICTSITSDLNNKLRKNFTAYKNDVKDGLDKEQEMAVAQASYDKIQCLTVGRLRKVVGACNVYQTAGQTLYNMMG